MKRRYKIVGWYCDDPTNEASTVYSLVTYVEAETRSMAFDIGEAQLRKIAARPASLMNWYVQEEKPCLTSAK